MTLLLRIGRVAPSCLLLAALATNAAAGQPAAAPAEPPSIASRTAGLTRIDGFIPLYWEARRGRLLMEIAHFGRELLYAVSLSGGLGSNQVGLDRGQPGPAEIIVFERVGPKVLVVARNYRFRASSGNAAERQAVADSFPSSVLWGFSVEAEEGDRVLVDATPFGVRAIATSNLRRLVAQLAARTDAHGRETRDDIERFLNRPGPPRQRTPPPAVPAGEPI